MEIAGLVAWTAVDPALRVDLQHRCHAGERPPASVRGRSELEPRNVMRRLAGHTSYYVGSHAAAIRVLPVRAGVITADRLTFEAKRRSRLSECPDELAVAAGLALINLSTLGV